MRDYWISCLVNPSVGREFEWDGDRLPPVETPRPVTAQDITAQLAQVYASPLD